MTITPMEKTEMTPVTYRPLGNTYLKNTFTYELLVREGDVAIYKQRLRPGVGLLAYEVIRIQKKEAVTINGVDVPAREIAPGNELWGTQGWAYPPEHLSRAKAKMRELLST